MLGSKQDLGKKLKLKHQTCKGIELFGKQRNSEYFWRTISVLRQEYLFDEKYTIYSNVIR